jgi:hypothetical protein
MDLDDVEQIDFNALGGADNIVIGWAILSGYRRHGDQSRSCGDPAPAGDGAADSVDTVNGTQGADVILAVGFGNSVSVSGLQAVVHITTTEAANDTLTSKVRVVTIHQWRDGSCRKSFKLVINGGLGDDVIFGSEVATSSMAAMATTLRSRRRR